MRLFVAIEIPPAVRANLAALLGEFRAIAPHIKWVRPENLHITLKFLGETQAAKLGEVQSSLATIRSEQRVTLDFNGLGFFPNAKRPRVFWAGLQSSSNLLTIAAEIDRSLHKIGFPLADRSFTAHLTLARFDRPCFLPALEAAISSDASGGLGSFSTCRFHLIESKLKSAGAEYTTVQSFSFAPEA